MPPANDRGSVSLDRSSGFAPKSDKVAALLQPRPGYQETASAGDPLGKTLGAVRMSGALFFVVATTTPFCIDVPHTRAYADIILPHAGHVISYHIMVDGGGWAHVPGVEPVRYGPGDIVVFPHGDPYVMQSAPGTPPEFTPAETIEFFRALAAGALPFVIPEGGGGDPPGQVICGFLGCQAEPFNPVLASLPRLLHLKRPHAGGGDLLDRLIDMTMDVAQAGGPGGAGVSARLSELLLIELLRQYAAAPVDKPAGWLAGLGDPPIARALTALHERPAAPWTVAALAREAGMSRSAFAGRFLERVGHAPMRYLTLWRMQLAAAELDETEAPLAAIAAKVGYASEAAFSRGFKRAAGLSPDAWRRRDRSSAATPPSDAAQA